MADNRPNDPRPQLHDYWMRYKRQGWGICTGVVRASNKEKAEELGRQFCAQSPALLFLTIEDPVLISE